MGPDRAIAELRTLARALPWLLAAAVLGAGALGYLIGRLACR